MISFHEVHISACWHITTGTARDVLYTFGHRLPHYLAKLITMLIATEVLKNLENEGEILN